MGRGKADTRGDEEKAAQYIRRAMSAESKPNTKTSTDGRDESGRSLGADLRSRWCGVRCGDEAAKGYTESAVKEDASMER